ncbi:MAG: IS1634 family transposase [Bacteroidetes bacterium]|nr:IS1634 family transposase [Bacteroidota bacterium]
MYLRTTKAKTKADGVVEYLQLCQNHYDKSAKRSKTEVVYNFGRKDDLDLSSIKQLITNLACYLTKETGEADQHLFADGFGSETVFLDSRVFGGTWLLDQLWNRLGISQVLHTVLAKRKYAIPLERLLFSLVANRALAPSSKLHIEHWVEHEAFIQGLPAVDSQQLYRAMDFFQEHSDALQKTIFHSVADLFNLEVDLLFLDTTTTYFEIEGEDQDITAITEEGEEERIHSGYRKRSKHGKDNHPELAQVVICFAVTRNGIPVKCWSWPGNTSDKAIIEEIKRDLNLWDLGRTIYVEDTGFNSAKNRRILRGAGDHYIIGEKLRLGRKAEAHPALKQRGKFKKLENGLEIKDILLDQDSTTCQRFIVIRNTDEAKRDKLKRDDIVREAERRIETLHQEKQEQHSKKTCDLRSHPVFGKYIKQSKTGKLSIDKGKIRKEEQFDGKYLISTSDLKLSSEEVVMGYKQLASIERVFRDMKHLIDIRPVYHRLEQRIRSHILLCWLAMLLIRIAEQEAGQTWFQMKKIFNKLHIGTLKTPEGIIRQTSELTPEMKKLFVALKIDTPKKVIQIET